MAGARILLIVLAPLTAFCQDVTPAICRGVLTNQSDYEKFFVKISGVPASTVSEAARQALDLSGEQIQAVMAISADLATRSCMIDHSIRPLMFDARLQLAGSDSIDPALQQKIQELKAQWAQAVTDHIQQLRTTLGPERFKTLDEAVRSAKPTADGTPRPKRRLETSGYLLY